KLRVAENSHSGQPGEAGQTPTCHSPIGTRALPAAAHVVNDIAASIEKGQLTEAREKAGKYLLATSAGILDASNRALFLDALARAFDLDIDISNALVELGALDKKTAAIGSTLGRGIYQALLLASITEEIINAAILSRAPQALIQELEPGFVGPPRAVELRSGTRALSGGAANRQAYIQALEAEGPLANGGGRPFRAVFLNYVIDCLPVGVLDVSGEEVKQLCVRTCVARTVNLEEHTDLTAAMLAERAKAQDSLARQELLEVYGLFASEYDYRPVNIAEVPHGAFAVKFAKHRVKRVLHNYGAILSLERLLDLVAEQGFILVNDYGQTQTADVENFEHQRFSLTTAMGLNFPLLKAFFEQPSKYRWVEPMGE